MSTTDTQATLEGMAKGGFGGYVTGWAIAPLVNAKIRKQQERTGTAAAKAVPQQTEPRAHFKGGGGFAASLGFTTALQKAINDFATAKALRAKGAPLSEGEQCLIAMGSGAGSSVGLNGAELVMSQMKRPQYKSSSFMETARALHRLHGAGVFFRGLPEMAGRESATTFTFFYAAPWATKKLKEMTGSETVSRVGAGVACGGAAVLATQPVDFWNIALKSDLSAARRLALSGAYSGGLQRWGIFTIATIIIPGANDAWDFFKQKLN